MQEVKKKLSFNKLTIIDEFMKVKNGVNQTYAVCRCECGNEKTLLKTVVVHGRVRSCGCGKRESNLENKTTHGMVGTDFYRHWANMKNRCKSSDRYRDIDVCERWDDFVNFQSDMYESYSEHVKQHGTRQTTLDRINTEDNYYPQNCRWATYKVQSNNTRKNKRYAVNGEKLTVSEIADKYNISYWAVRSRIKRGAELVREEELRCTN